MVVFLCAFQSKVVLEAASAVVSSHTQSDAMPHYNTHTDRHTRCHTMPHRQAELFGLVQFKFRRKLGCTPLQALSSRRFINSQERFQGRVLNVPKGGEYAGMQKIPKGCGPGQACKCKKRCQAVSVPEASQRSQVKFGSSIYVYIYIKIIVTK